MDELFVRVRGGGGVCVPASPSMTTYVLLEQEDWFEKEIAFVRRVLQPGMRAIDIGANYGLYTLAMAQNVGPEGAVWSYEPASAASDSLRRTIERNGLTNIHLLKSALSDRQGTARLRLFEQTELNRLAHDGDAGEEVELTTLDAEHERRGLGSVDFVKIDAEGEEVNIIRGGERFFAGQSPLVMFERTRDGAPNDAVAVAFRERGYDLYRLIGPDEFLLPLEPDHAFDAFEINLFACKPDRAERLAAAGLLVTDCAADADVGRGPGLPFWQRQTFAPAFAATCNAPEARYAKAFDAYAAWRDPALLPDQRCGALLTAAAMLQTIARDSRNLAHLSTAARVAHEAGQRAVALETLRRMLELLERGEPRLAEPFWPAAARYDVIAPRGDPRIWFLAATIEAYEQRRAFSSCLATVDFLKQLDWLQSTPYASAEMERRRQLFAIRVGRQRQRQPSPLLAKASADHLNPQLWGGR